MLCFSKVTSLMCAIHSLMNALRRAGTGLAAAHQGGYLQGWLPAMEQRPERPAPAASTAELPRLEQAGRIGAH